MEFHKAQLEAIRHFNGPCITLAGPGSGKTTVLTYRILNLIEKCGVAPEHILVITFTRAAATEMKERFLKLSDNRYSGVCFQTFHSFFFMILRKAYGYRADNIITQQEQTRFFKNILNEYELEITDTMELIRHATAWISNVKRSIIRLKSIMKTMARQKQLSWLQRCAAIRWKAISALNVRWERHCSDIRSVTVYS